jgi:hypothetical protein
MDVPSPSRYELPQFACEADLQFNVSVASPENLSTILKSGQSWKVVIKNVISFQVQVNVYPNFGLIVRAIFFIPNRSCRKTAIKVSVHCDNNASRKFTHENLNNAQYSATKLGVFLGGAKANGQPLTDGLWRIEDKIV